MSDALLSMWLDGKTALVTGAGRGLGRASSLALPEAGAEIVAWSRTASEIDSLVAEIEAKGGKTRAQVVDVTDNAGVRRAVDELEKVDILLNNAGSNIPQAFLEVDAASLDKVLGVNVRAVSSISYSAPICAWLRE
ncbi:MAG: SDR family NAD(P)-dependent oxidoreductase [Pseudomonadota bacterium]